MKISAHIPLLQQMAILAIGILCITGTAFAQNEAAAEGERIQVAESVQHRLINLIDNVSNRAEAATARFEQILGRIESRMTKLSAAGIDTSVATERLAQAKTSLAGVKSLIASLNSAGEAVSGSTPKESLMTIRTQLREIQTGLYATRQALIDTLLLLKEASKQSAPVTAEEIPVLE